MKTKITILSRYQKSLLLFIFIIIPVVATVSVLRGQGQNHATSKNKKEEATPIQPGVMTEKQKKHSKLFKGTHYEKGYKVTDLVDKKGDVQLSGPINEVPRLKLSLADSLNKLACNSDLVVIGLTKSKASNIIETGTFLFTDYEITVEEVLKNGEPSPVRQGEGITVPRLGGVVALKGHTVKAIDEEVSPLEMGERYVCFLKYEPLAETYRSFGHPMFDDTFLLHGDEVLQISRKPLPLGWKKSVDAAGFMSELRNALIQPCQTGGMR
jgi:hypothetical protein